MLNMRRWLGALFIVITGTAAASADAPGSMADLSAEIGQLRQQLVVQDRALKDLMDRLAALADRAESTRQALADDLAQPMLLLVGMGACPKGFKRIVTRVLILTRARNAENGHLFDEAGLPYEDPPGVGDNVYRDLDFCFRPAHAVQLK